MKPTTLLFPAMTDEAAHQVTQAVPPSAAENSFDLLVRRATERMAGRTGVPVGVLQPMAERFAEEIARFVVAWVEGGRPTPDVHRDDRAMVTTDNGSTHS